MLKDELRELGSRDVNLDAAIEFMEKGLHNLVNKRDDQVSVHQRCSKIEHAIPTEMWLKDQSGVIVPFEGLKLDNNMSDARCEVCSDTCLGFIPMQALGTFRHPRTLRDGLCANTFTYTPGSYSSASSHASASASASKPSGWCEECQLDAGPLHAVGFCESPTDIQRRKMGVANLFGANLDRCN